MYAHPHTRASYAAGCRCTPCRAANAAYVAQRRAQPEPLIAADTARAQLAQLAQLGIGLRRCATLAGVSVRRLRRIRDGRIRRIRRTTEARIVAIVPTLAHGARVAATKTWRFVDSLRREGFTHRDLARRLGQHAQQLQLGKKHVTVRSALRMAALYDRLAAQ